jgi:hypothetical protein
MEVIHISIIHVNIRQGGRGRLANEMLSLTWCAPQWRLVITNKLKEFNEYNLNHRIKHLPSENPAGDELGGQRLYHPVRVGRHPQRGLAPPCRCPRRGEWTLLASRPAVALACFTTRCPTCHTQAAVALLLPHALPRAHSIDHLPRPFSVRILPGVTSGERATRGQGHPWKYQGRSHPASRWNIPWQWHSTLHQTAKITDPYSTSEWNEFIFLMMQSLETKYWICLWCHIAMKYLFVAIEIIALKL